MAKPKQYHASMIVLAEYAPDEILRLTGLDMPDRIFKVGDQEYLVRMNSLRYATFVESGVACVQCGLVGDVMRLEHFKNARHNRPHFNLYGFRNGQSILLTKDHIIPKSLGGRDEVYNLQTMCTICNVAKGAKIEVTL